MISTVDVDENKWDKDILKILLIDRTTNRNIIWGTSDYEVLGLEYNSHFPIEVRLITGEHSGIIKPRVLKSKEKQGSRTKEKAEVFTPSWICNAQANLIDHAWFDKKDVFNIEGKKSWKSTKEKIDFPNTEERTWKDYVSENRLEITCGEAPYLVSRYDTVSGEPIPLKERIGFLDRKLRIVNENTNNEREWLYWTRIAFESIYGFEFQGDSLLIARENLLATFCDYMRFKLNRNPNKGELEKIAEIISWNLWQMDGLNFTIPYKTPVEPQEQLSFFGNENNNENVMCIIKDWKKDKIVTFEELTKGGKISE